jgi:hypothetical protein
MVAELILSDNQSNATKSSNKVFNENAKNVKVLIDKKIANINPLTNIVEPAFNKFASKQAATNCNTSLIDLNSLRTGRTEIKLSKAQEEEMQEKLKTHLNTTISGIDKEKFNEEKLAFVRELEDQYHQSNLVKINKEQEAKKGRKLRKEYTLPPKPVKGMAFYQMESKKYEAAKYYLLNQNSTTLSKTCKKFNVSVPTLITYMDKDRVEAYLKTGKYSGTAAKRERRNVKNQYKEKEQLSDKWVETIKTLINDTPGSEEGSTILNNDTGVFASDTQSPLTPKLTKKESAAALHLEASKKIMKDTQVKLQNLKTSKTQIRKINGNNITNNKMPHIENDPIYDEARNKVFLPPLKINQKNPSLKDVRNASPSSQQPAGNLMHLANLSSISANKNQGVSAQGFGILSLDSTYLYNQNVVDRGYVNFSRPGSNYFNNSFSQNGNGYKVPPLTAGSNVGYPENDSRVDLNSSNHQRMYFLSGSNTNPNMANNKTFPFLPINSKSSTLLSSGSMLDPIDTPAAKPFNGAEDIVDKAKSSNFSSLETRHSLPTLNTFNFENQNHGSEYYSVENIYDSVKNIPESNDRNKKLVSSKDDIYVNDANKPKEKQYVQYENKVQQNEKTSAGSFVFTPPNSGSTSKNINQPEFY